MLKVNNGQVTGRDQRSTSIELPNIEDQRNLIPENIEDKKRQAAKNDVILFHDATCDFKDIKTESEECLRLKTPKAFTKIFASYSEITSKYRDIACITSFAIKNPGPGWFIFCLEKCINIPIIGTFIQNWVNSAKKEKVELILKNIKIILENLEKELRRLSKEMNPLNNEEFLNSYKNLRKLLTNYPELKNETDYEARIELVSRTYDEFKIKLQKWTEFFNDQDLQLFDFIREYVSTLDNLISELEQIFKLGLKKAENRFSFEKDWNLKYKNLSSRVENLKRYATFSNYDAEMSIIDADVRELKEDVRTAQQFNLYELADYNHLKLFKELNTLTSKISATKKQASEQINKKLEEELIVSLRDLSIYLKKLEDKTKNLDSNDTIEQINRDFEALVRVENRITSFQKSTFNNNNLSEHLEASFNPIRGKFLLVIDSNKTKFERLIKNPFKNIDKAISHYSSFVPKTEDENGSISHFSAILKNMLEEDQKNGSNRRSSFMNTIKNTLGRKHTNKAGAALDSSPYEAIKDDIGKLKKVLNSKENKDIDFSMLYAFYFMEDDNEVKKRFSELVSFLKQ